MLSVRNPFGAPVYYRETVTSTMDEARLLKDSEHGTVIAADCQSAGRGRSGRPWQADSGESLSFTVILHYGAIAEIPPCLTLRAGLVVSTSIEDFAAHIQGSQLSPLAGRVQVKWPNDVMLLDKADRGKKAVGILTEAENGTVYIGIGVNIAQKTFPPEIEEKACSIAQIVSQGNDKTFLTIARQRFTLLEMILSRLYEELQAADSLASLRLIDERLYMKGKRVTFISGQPEELSAASRKNPEIIEGILQGINQNGEICIATDSGEMLSFVTGELKVY